MIYNNYHYLELCVIIHAWLLLVEVFFKGVHLECEKNPIHIIHFIGYLSAKYLLLFPINPIPHKLNACSFTDENLSRFF